jgi:hypothetical protein
VKSRYYKNFIGNQYETYNGGFFLRGEHVDARYIKQQEPTYMNNLLIEALPPVKSMEYIYNVLERRPIYSKEERNKPEEYRLQALYRLHDFLFPTSTYFEVASYIAVAIRRGYTGKHIMTPQYIQQLYDSSNKLRDKESQEASQNTIVSINNNISTSLGFSIFGPSGAGKSTAVQNILSLYPQCIVHYGYEGNRFLFKQLTWLKIDCSHNGSIKGICLSFFKQVDNILGETYFNKYSVGRYSIDMMIQAMAHIVIRHGLGLLVIDEIQHLRLAQNDKSKAEGALNFFVTLMNEIKLPILYIGTYKAINAIFSKDYRHSRRGESIGIVNMGFLSKDDEWDMLLAELWQYQWTKEFCELTEEISDLIYDCSLGIMDRLVKLFIMAQFEAIVSGREKINCDLIKKVSEEKFKLTHKMAKAMKSGNISEMHKYEDLYMPNIDSIIENNVQDIKNKEMLRDLINSSEHKEKSNKKSVIDEICIYISQIDSNLDNIRGVVTKLVDEYGYKDIALIRKKAIQIIVTHSQDAPGNKEKKVTKEKKSKVADTSEFIKENIKEIDDFK